MSNSQEVLLHKLAYKVQLSGLKQLKKARVRLLVRQQKRFKRVALVGQGTLAYDKLASYDANVKRTSASVNKIKQNLVALELARNFVCGLSKRHLSLNRTYPISNFVVQNTNAIVGLTHEDKELTWTILCLQMSEYYQQEKHKMAFAYVNQIPSKAEEYLKNGVTITHKHNAILLWMNKCNQNHNKTT